METQGLINYRHFNSVSSSQDNASNNMLAVKRTPGRTKSLRVGRATIYAIIFILQAYLIISTKAYNQKPPLTTTQQQSTSLRPIEIDPSSYKSSSKEESAFQEQQVSIFATTISALRGQQVTNVTPPSTTTTTSTAQEQKIELLNSTSPNVGQPMTGKLVPVLRPSIEVVASELSKKHLNLEYENWRFKQTSSAATPTSQRPSSAADLLLSSQVYEELVSSDEGSSDQAEQEISAPTALKSSGASVKTSQPSNDGSLAATKLNSDRQLDHYLHIDTTAAADLAHHRARQQGASRRRKKTNLLPNEDSELYYCHQYLLQHSSPSVSSSSTYGAGGRQLPCSCESRRDLSWEMTGQSAESTWLSCDNVQLIGSHFYSSTQASAAADGNDDSTTNSSTSGGDSHANSNKAVLLTRFSQRDSGLQTLHSQKFHYLQLFYLKSIDLSDNRIRQIKMDAFHGLENKVEYLNLANNQLGDFRAMFAETPSSNGAGGQKANIGRLMFQSDELSRLRMLRWLSLRNNQISLLGSSVFIKNPNPNKITGNSNEDAATILEPVSEMTFLDLSENLFKFIPSDSIQQLNKLQTLNLRRNRISQLDQWSKFPKSIKFLDLSENLIKIIRRCDLIDLPNLLELNLSNNQLSNLDKTAFLSSTALSAINNLMNAAPTVAGQVNLFDQRSEISQVEGGDKDRLLSQSGLEDDHKSQSRARTRRNTGELDDDESVMMADRDRMEMDDLDAEESVVSMSNSRHTISEDAASSNQMDQFNATIKLDLSYNFFEKIPGDSLLKFTNLQHLDLSFNRIRKLDSNYLCSIYNLVDNLRQLNLSGNLLSIANQSNTINDNGSTKQLYKLFSCLQKLEKLSLSTNRLAWGDLGTSEPSSANDDQTGAIKSEQAAFYSTNQKNSRLVVRFGEGYTSRFLNTLDLSDNQLRYMPIMELVNNNQAIVLSNATGRQSNLNQWMSFRINLEILSLNYNYIERLDEHDFEHLTNIRELSLDHNKLLSLPTKLMQRFTNLERLQVKGNRIASIGPLNELFERSIRTLRLLDLSYNRLMDWPTMTKQMLADSGPINDDKQSIMSFALQELNLEGNLLTSSNVSSLFDQLVYMKSLETLNLGYNLLSRVKSEWFKFANKNLRKILFTGNKINNIDLGSFASNQVNELVQLSLDYNLMKELKRKTFDSLPRIRELNLGHNLIHTISSETFYQVNSLKVLKLNNNKLTSWKCEYFSNLCNSITGNINADLSTLLSYGLHKEEATISTSTVSSLVELDLSYNSLSQLRANSISVHTKLAKLNLGHNKLAFIPHDLFKATTAGSATGRQIQLVSSLKYLNLAHNRIQTIDNINFRPLKNLLSLDLGFNELQTLGVDVVKMDTKNIDQDHNRKIIVNNNFTDLLVDDEMFGSNRTYDDDDRQPRSDRLTSNGQQQYPTGSWPALSKLRYLNLANNQLTMVNQSLLNELSPFALLNLNLSSNFLDSEALPNGFYTKISGVPKGFYNSPENKQLNYDLVFTLKLESLDLSHNRLSEFPTHLLDNHCSSMETCNLSHNRIQSVIPNSNMMLQIKSLNLEFNPLNRESNELVLFEQRSVRSLNMAATRLYAIQQATSTLETPLGTSLQLRNRLANQTSQLDLIRSISRPIDAPYLRYLNLSSNQLVWLAANVFDKMHSLQTLDLSNNQLTRLNLLNNQLSHVSSTLEYLSMASNLFTNVDSNDLSQLSRLRHLDLSNLPSLQKINCNFLSKLSTLSTLKMSNYPQLRQNLNNLLMTLNADETSAHPSERLQRKLRYDLIMSTIGKHCFVDNFSSYAFVLGLEENPPRSHEAKWFNLKELDLELFNNFHTLPRTGDGSYKLANELTQLLGPQTRKLTLVGLNLTSLSDESLLGITNEQLKLKISYTSISQLPLMQILNGVAKRTKLELDFRHNNIHSIDTREVQILDELQLNNQLLQSGDHSSLKLSFNPIRCDCQTRPLWLWLNQRWGQADAAQNEDQQASDVPPTSNFWLKFNSISQSSDLTCYYPLKLRGKLTQHVYYNDLICSSPSSGRQSRKRNDTRPSELYYVTSATADSVADSGESEDDDYADFMDGKIDSSVRVTKFNRHPSVFYNGTYYFESLFLVHNKNEDTLRDKNLDDDAGKIERDHGLGDSRLTTSSSVVEQDSSTRYSRYRPNIHQKHSSFNTLNAFNQITSKTLLSSKTQPVTGGKKSLLTELDVMILTIISSAMTIMSFVIIAICLFKYKMDQSDREKIISTHTKYQISPAVQPDSKKSSRTSGRSGGSKLSRSSGSSRGSSSKESDKSSSPRQETKLTGGKSIKLVPSVGLVPNQQFIEPNNQVLVPIGPTASILAPVTQNFLMRSPTIRRMQGLATNASDWFKFTLRAYPSGAARRRQGLFKNGSQLTTSKFMPNHLRHPPNSSSILPISSAAGCPIHGLKSIKRLKEWKGSVPMTAEQCLFCAQLLAAVQQTHVQQVATSGQKTAQRFVGELGKDNPKDCGTNQVIQSGEMRFNQIQKSRFPEWNQQSSPDSYYSRVQQAKPLRTFGSNHLLTSSNNNSKIVGSDNMQDQLQSELPTEDVDGRFTYQTESQIESPIYMRSVVQKDGELGTRDRSEIVSNGNDQSDIFILVHELAAQQDESQSCQNQGIEIVRLDENSELASSVMNDECSQSSSPVAYGFMRSSPSINSFSSNTLTTQNQYIVNNSNEMLHTMQQATTTNNNNVRYSYNQQQPSLFKGSPTDSRTRFSSSCNMTNMRNNNETDYSVIKKREPVALKTNAAPQNGSDSSKRSGDQIIISRL